MPMTRKPRFVSVPVLCLVLLTLGGSAAFGGDSRARRKAQALLEEAEKYVELAPLTAVSKYKEALEIARKSRDRPIEASARLGLGSTRHSPDVAEQIAHLKIAAEIFAELGDRTGQAEALETQGRTYVEWSFNRLSLELYDRALELRRTTGAQGDLAALYARRADVHELLGNYEQALQELGEALSLWQEAGSQLEVAKVHYRLALLSSTLGLDDPALLHLKAAEGVSETLSAGFDVEQFQARNAKMGYERLMKTMATFKERYQESGGLPDGEKHSQPPDPKLDETREKTQEVEQLRPFETPLCAFALSVAVKNALGELYASLGRDELARKHFEDAWAAWAAYDQGGRQILGPEAGNAEEISLRLPGVPAPSRVLPGCKDLPNDPSPLWKADALWVVGRLQEALVEYRSNAGGDAYRGEIPEIRAAALRGMGDVHLELGDPQAALASYLRAVEVVESMQGDLRLERLTSGLASRQAGLYSGAVKLAVELGREAEAFSLAERGRARAFLNRLGNRRIASSTAPPELAAKERELRERRI